MRDDGGKYKTFEEEMMMSKVKAYATNGLKTYGVMFGIIVVALLGLALFFATTGTNTEEGTGFTYLPLEVVSIDEHGVIFYDENAEFEPNIFMAHEDLIDESLTTKFKFQRFEVGQMVMGEFDAEGWELYAVK